MAVVDKEKIRKIYESLPKLNCGLCGHDNCGQFARAVAEGRTSPFGCRQNPWIGYRLSEIVGVKVPSYSYGVHPVSSFKQGAGPSPKALKEEVRGLFQKVDDILVRIETLKARK